MFHYYYIYHELTYVLGYKLNIYKFNYGINHSLLFLGKLNSKIKSEFPGYPPLKKNPTTKEEEAEVEQINKQFQRKRDMYYSYVYYSNQFGSKLSKLIKLNELLNNRIKYYFDDNILEFITYLMKFH